MMPPSTRRKVTVNVNELQLQLCCHILSYILDSADVTSFSSGVIQKAYRLVVGIHPEREPYFTVFIERGFSGA